MQRLLTSPSIYNIQSECIVYIFMNMYREYATLLRQLEKSTPQLAFTLAKSILEYLDLSRIILHMVKMS